MTSERRIVRRTKPPELISIKKGYCKATDLFDVLESRIGDARFTKKKFGTWLTAQKDIEAPDVVKRRIFRYGKDPFEEFSRGVDKKAIITILERLCARGSLEAGTYKLPAPLNNVTCTVRPMTTTKERWSDDAKHAIAACVQQLVPIEDIIAELVDEGFRKKGLTKSTLGRQIPRLVGDFLSEAECAAYKKEFLKSRSPKTPKTPKTPKVTKARKTRSRSSMHWSTEHQEALVRLATGSLRLSKTSGKENCRKIGRKLKKNGVRSSSGQAVSHALRQIMTLPLGQRHGLTEERYSEVINPRKYYKAPQGNLPLRAPQEKPLPATTGAHLMVKAENGFLIALTPEQQEAALQEFLTPEERMRAFQAYVNNRVGG